jgi:hypothetical protein
LNAPAPCPIEHCDNEMLQLYVLGPAFGLPSVDAECNAAVALLKSHFNGNQDGWEIIPTHEHQTTLPYLRNNDTTIQGYSAIAQHVSDVLTITPTSLTAKQAADSTALTSFITTHAPTLLSISLYVSSENYRHATRPAFTALLPWHANYILPPRRRAAARAFTRTTIQALEESVRTRISKASSRKRKIAQVYYCRARIRCGVFYSVLSMRRSLGCTLWQRSSLHRSGI